MLSLMTKLTMGTKTPRHPAISINTAVRRCNTKRITQCSMPRATPEATGCCHRATTHSALPWRPPGRQSTINKTMMQNTPPLLAIFMAVAVCRYYTVHIAWWRRFMAFIKATRRRHWTSTCSNITQSDPWFWGYISSSNQHKRARVDI